MSPTTSAGRAEWSRRLARALVAGGFVSESVVATYLVQATENNIPLSVVLMQREAQLGDVVLNTLGQLARMRVVDLEVEPPVGEIRQLLPPLLALEYRAIPLRVSGNQVVTAFAEPPEPDDVAAVAGILGHEIVAVLANPVMVDRMVQPAEAHAGNGTAPTRQAGHVSPLSDHPAAFENVPTPDDEAVMPRHARIDDPPTPTALDAVVNAVPPPSPTVMAPPPPPPPPPPLVLPPPPPTMARVPDDGQSEELGPPSLADTLGGSASFRRRRASDVGFRLHIDDLLRYVVNVGASDLHLSANLAPTVRLNGALRPMDDIEPLDGETLQEMIFGVLPQTMRERFEAEHELDTSHSVAGVGRFRVNVAFQRGTVAVALRPIPHDIPEFDNLGLPQSVKSFTDLRRGLVLVTGPTGSGKSTSLASLIDIINRTKPLHIVTVEDPIEFLHTHKRSVISQREVGSDTFSFSEALRRVLRQDPDVILVGELRDLETIATALTAAETGHLVFATLHTQDAPSTIDRVIDVFPPSQQEQIRIQLASSLRGVVTQQLIPVVDGSGRAVAAEVLVCTPAIQNLIRAAKTHQIYSLMQTGSQFGMQTMDQNLATLVQRGVISVDMGLDR
ncbi:MAG TPA: PilT/PilU family type 4a pilus ATPase, partial [Acidimicrobiales bacterium]|nr:PilT/PilU family type 4a pilus ATPase [Acidimicrobiales bacterium]